MIHVLATIKLAEGGREEFLKAFRELVPLVQAEEGCIEYGPAIDVETTLPAQQPLGENAVMVIEKWRDADALADHLAAPHMLEYRKQVKDLVLGMQLAVLQPA
jgi:quinol monooxygenase YgiN